MNWKIIAIIFICLFVLTYIAFSYMYGKNICATKCVLDENCDNYSYNFLVGSCALYKNDKQISGGFLS